MPRRFPDATCPVCGMSFRPSKSSAPGGVQLTCSRPCGQIHRAREMGLASQADRHCEACGASFNRRPAGRDAGRYCSRACGFEMRRREAAAREASLPPRPIRSCRGCGRCRRDDERWRAWCSYRCRVNDCGERVKDLYRLACGVGAEPMRWREMLVGYLRERDGDRCGICHRGIRFDLKSGPKGDDRGPSIDHIEPRSLGGSDDLANLRLAHWGCNRARKTGRPGEAVQLALVG